ncbi:MAG: N-acetylglucosamine-6-phosphate deacetylase [Lachnospiraceae bacterium]|nr:N-acetylglucosamine-6-phosphate deacetylase [Lachnospiraceae bacterium]
MIINNAEVYIKDFAFAKKNIRIDNGIYEKISDDPVSPLPGEEVIDATGMRLIPGLSDIHFHGASGHDLCDGTDEAIAAIARYEKSRGVMNICPATMTLSAGRLKEICRTAAAHRGCADEARLIGINLEGPFISPDKVGAQNPEHVIKPDAEILEILIDASDGLARLVTIAPEAEGAASCIEKLSGRIHFSVGHTCADYEQAMEGFRCGADHVTHLYNAMPPFAHRDPGVIGAAADSPGVYAEIICDGVHVHPSAVRAAFKMFGADRIVLVSDSMRACGMPDGDYELGGMPVVKRGRQARQPGGTLAGSVTDLYACMTEAIAMGIPEADAVRAAAYNPLASIGLQDIYDVIDEGRNARALLAGPDWKLIRTFG